MSQQNVELHRRALDAYNARDIEAFIEIADPDIEFHSAFAEIGGVYRGHNDLRKLQGDLDDAWGDDRYVESEAYFDLGEQTLLFQVIRVRGRQSGAEVELPSANLMRWRDGRCVYGTMYSNREDALRDLGISEDELEPIAP